MVSCQMWITKKCMSVMFLLIPAPPPSPQSVGNPRQSRETHVCGDKVPRLPTAVGCCGGRHLGQRWLTTSTPCSCTLDITWPPHPSTLLHFSATLTKPLAGYCTNDVDPHPVFLHTLNIPYNNILTTPSLFRDINIWFNHQHCLYQFSWSLTFSHFNIEH